MTAAMKARLNLLMSGLQCWGNLLCPADTCQSILGATTSLASQTVSDDEESSSSNRPLSSSFNACFNGSLSGNIVTNSGKADDDELKLLQLLSGVNWHSTGGSLPPVLILRVNSFFGWRSSPQSCFFSIDLVAKVDWQWSQVNRPFFLEEWVFS